MDQFLDSDIRRMEIATIVGLARGCSPTYTCKPIAILEWCYVLVIFTRNASVQRLQFLDLDDQFLDSAYHRHPEAEPNIESGLQRCLFVALPCLQTSTANNLISTQQHCFYSIHFSHQISDKFWNMSVFKISEGHENSNKDWSWGHPRAAHIILWA